jgi:4'-phosphopantetheinyl transferase
MAETELWLINLDTAAGALEAIEQATPRLPDDLLHRLDMMSDAAARRERRLAHVALRILLERRAGPAMRREPYLTASTGKPSLATCPVSFSLAHTKGLALVAISEAARLGVDIERTRMVRVPDVRRAPIEAEAVVLAGGVPLLGGADRDSRFLNAWVRIEAVAKALGTGVGPILERVRPASSPPANQSGESASVVAHDIETPVGIFAAVALSRAAVPPPARILPGTTQAIAALLEAGDGRR